MAVQGIATSYNLQILTGFYLTIFFVNVILIYWFPFPALTAELRHTTLLEELVFWTVKYEFPERLVCLLLKLLPDTQYKEALTRSFVRHYSRVSMMLMKSHNSDKLSNRIVHVSVQLFSNEELGTYIDWVLFKAVEGLGTI